MPLGLRAAVVSVCVQHESHFLPVLQSKCTASDLSEAARKYEVVKADLPHPKVRTHANAHAHTHA